MSSALTRRALLGRTALAGLALGVPLLAACSPASTSAPPAAPAGLTSAPVAPSTPGAASTLRVGYLPITDAAPLLIAHARGFYQGNGLDAPAPTLFRSWAQIAEAFQARQVDVAHLLMPMTIQMRFGQQFPLNVVAWDHVNGSALTVAPDIQRVEDLAGQTVGIPFWFSIHNVMLQQLLKKAGLTPIVRGDASATGRTVKLVIMAPPDMPPALGQGSIKGYIVAEPFNAVAESGQVGRILRFTGDMWRDHACCVVVMHEDVVKQRPDFAQAAVTSVAQAQRYLRENRSTAAQLLSKDGQNYLPQPAAVIDRALNHYDQAEYGPTGAIQHSDWQSTRTDFQPFPFETYTRELVTLLKETVVDGDADFVGQLDGAQVQRELVNEQFARTAIAATGGAAAFGIADSLTRTEQVLV
jgi:NitT/TauT family transport system substrate-binding protein